MLTLGAPRLPTGSPYFWSAVAAQLVACLLPWQQRLIREWLSTGDAHLERITRDQAERVIRAAMPALRCPHCRAECVLSIIALDLVPVAGRAWRAALLSELENCDGR
jgi:hypothetical protein